MKLQIVQIGDPILRAKARELTLEEIKSPEIQQLIQLMKDTIDNAGVGLAAPQIGQSLQVVVIQDKKEYWQSLSEEELKKRERKELPFHVIINPKLTVIEKEGEIDFYEGCMSVGMMAKVPRALSVKVECLNEKAEPITINARGWYARILQHEIDHLNGIINIDRMREKTLSTIENYKQFLPK